MRAKKIENGVATYYIRSSVLGGQVAAEINSSGSWTRGFVYLGGQMVALQGGSGGAVSWVHQDPVTKSQRVTNSSGTIISTIDLDPWGGETGRSLTSAFQPHRYTSYERDGNGDDDAMMRRYQSTASQFSQPDPYDGSYSLANPQSFNRYAYVNNDPVNFVDPSGLMMSTGCTADQDMSACYGSGGGGAFWGGGFNMNARVSLLGSSGQQTIADAEYDHDYRHFPENGAFHFHSAFEGQPWFGFLGFPQEAGTRPQQNNQQKLDNCVLSALGKYLKADTIATLKHAAAQAGIGLGVGISMAWGGEIGAATAVGKLTFWSGMTSLHGMAQIGMWSSFALKAGQYWLSTVQESFSSKKEFASAMRNCFSEQSQ